MIEYRCISVGPLYTNCYLLFDIETSECIVIDPGGDIEKIVAMIEGLKLKPIDIFLTHGHIDHIAGADILAKKTGISLFIHSLDSSLLSDPVLNLSSLFGEARIIEKFNVFEENHTIKIGNNYIKIYNTPGHTPGSCCFHFDKNMICGDLLFRDGVGRTDLPLGDELKLKSSLKWLCSSFSGDLNIHPGHGESTTLKREMDSNYYLKYLDIGDQI